MKKTILLLLALLMSVFAYGYAAATEKPDDSRDGGGRAASGTAAEIFVQLGHSSHVGAVAFSSDGRTLVSGSHDKTLKLWDVASGRELRTLSGHGNDVRAVAPSPPTGARSFREVWTAASACGMPPPAMSARCW